MDLFDWLEIISKLRDEGLTQAKIGEWIGWSRSAVLNHVAILNGIDTPVLGFAMQRQTGRVSETDTIVSFNFTEGLLRNILPLTDEQQLKLLKKLIKGKDQKGHKYTKTEFKEEAATLKKYNLLVGNGLSEIEGKVFGEILQKAENVSAYNSLSFFQTSLSVNC